jgi:uncharacterized Fe-S radical SAM superfamily protein PflX
MQSALCEDMNELILRSLILGSRIFSCRKRLFEVLYQEMILKESRIHR